MEINNSGFSVAETKQLFTLAAELKNQNKSLRTAFEEIAKITGKKPNSVRNYYYSQLKTLTLLPNMAGELGVKLNQFEKNSFKTFERNEIENLVRDILIGQGKGKSVRAITNEMGNGDKSETLRIQNKYRSVIFTKRKYAESIMQKLSDEKQTYYNPYTKSIVVDGVLKETETGRESIYQLADKLNDDSARLLVINLENVLKTACERAAKFNARDVENLAAKADSLSVQLYRREDEINSLRAENERLLRMSVKGSDAKSEQLKRVNTFFLAQNDKDKVRVLEDYVKQLKALLAK